MKATAGIWIDHRRAIIVTSSDTGNKTTEILSNVEKQQGRIDGVRSVDSYESYYDEVVSSIRDAESILLLGPGEAKDELQKRLAKSGLDDRVVEVETADKMTVPQIVSKIHRFFLAVPA